MPHRPRSHPVPVHHPGVSMAPWDCIATSAACAELSGAVRVPRRPEPTRCSEGIAK